MEEALPHDRAPQRSSGCCVEPHRKDPNGTSKPEVGVVLCASPQVRVLLAVEAGSRTWGLSTTTSDLDVKVREYCCEMVVLNSVKFIYIRPLEWYLSLEEGRRDVIEYQNDKDGILLGAFSCEKSAIVSHRST